MKLRVLTPTEVVLDEDVQHVTVEDPTGSLGIRTGHAPLVTPLVRGILMARSLNGHTKYVAVDGGAVVVTRDGVEVVSRQAVLSDDLGHLEDTVLARFQQEADQDKTRHVAFEKMRINFMRQVLELERTGERI